jgi:hypothetical protein
VTDQRARCLRQAGAQEKSTTGRYNLSSTMTPLDLAATQAADW